MRALLGFLFIVLTIIGLSAAAGYAVTHNGFPDILAMAFPEIFDKDRDKPKPEETLLAPFATPESLAAHEKAADDNALKIPYEPIHGVNSDKALTEPHRTKDEIATWLLKAISEALNVTGDNYENHLAFLKTGMDDYAIADFQKFMNDSNILATLRANGLKLQVYVEEKPVMLNSGALENRYRWLLETPVTLSFLPRDMTTYKDVSSKDIMKEYVIVKTQVGRVADTGSAEGVKIESWDVRRNNKDTR